MESTGPLTVQLLTCIWLSNCKKVGCCVQSRSELKRFLSDYPGAKSRCYIFHKFKLFLLLKKGFNFNLFPVNFTFAANKWPNCFKIYSTVAQCHSNIQIQPGLKARLPLIYLKFKSSNKLVFHNSVNFRAHSTFM